jgi:hypothetical protein
MSVEERMMQSPIFGLARAGDSGSPSMMAEQTANDPRPYLVAGYLGSAAVAAQFAQAHGLPMPVCWFREFTGLPCPTCGGTRCLLAMGHLDFVSALRFNPLIAIGCVGLALWIVIALFDRAFRTGVTVKIRRIMSNWPVLQISGALVVFNWIYLLWALPR